MIAIIGAMEKEVEAILELVDQVKLIENHNITHYTARYKHHDLVIAQSGIGKVEAAYVVTSLLNQYKIDLVINVGSAGGLQPGQKVGDIVIGKSFRYHDLIFYYNDPLEGIEKYDFSANPKTVELMQKSLEELKIRHWIGQIVSGDQFVSEAAQFESILSRFPFAICVEMEATVIAHICKLHGTEFIVIRSLSDIPLANQSHQDFDKYLSLASRSSARASLMFLEKWKN